MRKSVAGRTDNKLARGNSKKKLDKDLPDRVVGFLQRIRGLNSLPPKELEDLLYARRFELLGLPPPKTGGAEGGTDGDKDQLALPEYSTIPNQHELHDALVSGLIPCGYQCVAHVLYPDSVPWPVRATSAGGGKPVQAAAAGASTAADTVSTSAPSSPSAPAKQRSGVSASSEAKQGTIADGEAETNRQDNKEAGNTGSPQKRPADAGDVKDAENGDAGGQKQKWDSLFAGQQKQETGPCSFTLCGQKVATSVRGKPVQEPSEDLLQMYMKAADDERYNAAREERLRLERAVKLEQYQERKLLERIKNLDVLRSAEVDHQDDIRKRDARRVARKEELKKQLEDAWAVKLKKEAEEKELEKQKKEMSAEEQKRLQKHYEKQRQSVSEWHASKAHIPLGEEGLAVQKAEKEKLAKEKEQEKERERKQKPKTVKSQLADEKVQRLQEAAEQRPPLPPARPRDLARPAADLLDETCTSGGKSGPSQTARQSPVSWTKEAKKVADNYGLTPREHTAVESRLGRCVQGAGRMAKHLER